MSLLIYLSTTRASTKYIKRMFEGYIFLRPERVNLMQKNKTILQIKQKSDQAKDKSYLKPKTFSIEELEIWN